MTLRFIRRIVDVINANVYGASRVVCGGFCGLCYPHVGEVLTVNKHPRRECLIDSRARGEHSIDHPQSQRWLWGEGRRLFAIMAPIEIIFRRVNVYTIPKRMQNKSPHVWNIFCFSSVDGLLMGRWPRSSTGENPFCDECSTHAQARPFFAPKRTGSWTPKNFGYKWGSNSTRRNE